MSGEEVTDEQVDQFIATSLRIAVEDAGGAAEVCFVEPSGALKVTDEYGRVTQSSRVLPPPRGCCGSGLMLLLPAHGEVVVVTPLYSVHVRGVVALAVLE